MASNYSNCTASTRPPPEVWTEFFDLLFVAAIVLAFCRANLRVLNGVSCILMLVVGIIRISIRGVGPFHASTMLLMLTNFRDIFNQRPRVWWLIMNVVYILDTIYTEMVYGMCPDWMITLIMTSGIILYTMSAILLLTCMWHKIPAAGRKAFKNLIVLVMIFAIWMIIKKAFGGETKLPAAILLGYLIGTLTPIKPFRSNVVGPGNSSLGSTPGNN